jgi:FkbM family methyltransferase
MKLTTKQKLSYTNHLFKAFTRHYHGELEGLFSNFIKQDSVVFDIGGHAGQFTKLFSKMVPRGKVFTFEPSSYTRSILQSMAGIKFLSNVFVLPFGLSDQPSLCKINTPVKNKGGLGYGLAFVGSTDQYERDVVQSEIVLSTVDHIVEALSIDRVDFIKADIEGCEYLMLQGAEKTLKTHKPALYLELNDDALGRNNHTGQQVHDFLRKIGYQNVYKVNEKAGTLEQEMEAGACNFRGNYLFTDQDLPY